jgi:PiT family inorganic phosphate transporter
VISAHALDARRALVMTTAGLLIAPFVFGVAVARAFGAGIVAPAAATVPIVLAGTLSALLWRWLTWWLGIPSSSSHALVGGLMGAALAGAGLVTLNLPGLLKVLAALLLSPGIGLAAGFALTRLIYYVARSATPRINKLFRRAQIATAFLLAVSWGANDAQKTIGLLALGVAAASRQPFAISPLVILLSMAAVALGTLAGGWRLIRTLGGRFYRIRPVHGLAAQTASAGVILGAAAVGGPVSTTQVVSTAILGAGAADRINMVRWGVAADIFWAWVLTLPATALLGAGFYWLLRWVP